MIWRGMSRVHALPPFLQVIVGAFADALMWRITSRLLLATGGRATQAASEENDPLHLAPGSGAMIMTF
jgi:hypothetical protein